MSSLGVLGAVHIPKGRVVEAVYVREAVLQYKRAGRFKFDCGAIRTSRDVVPILRKVLPLGPQERFVVLACDAKMIPTAYYTAGVGGLTYCTVDPGSVFRFAITAAASSLILCHNHPSGDVQPSREDILLTSRLQEAGKLLGVSVVEHVILAEDEHFSFADSRLI